MYGGKRSISFCKHVLRFGRPNRVGKLLASLRSKEDSKVSYLEISTAPSSRLPATRIYANPDKNQATLRLEMADRKLKPLISEFVQNTYFDSLSFTVSSEWKSIVKISFQDDLCTLDWAPGNSEYFKIPTAQITAAFHESLKRSTRVSTWV